MNQGDIPVKRGDHRIVFTHRIPGNRSNKFEYGKLGWGDLGKYDETNQIFSSRSLNAIHRDLITMPYIKNLRRMPSAADLVSVQPMAPAPGELFKLDYTYGNDDSDGNDVE